MVWPVTSFFEIEPHRSVVSSKLTRRMGSSAFHTRFLLFVPDQDRTVDKLAQARAQYAAKRPGFASSQEG